MNLYIFSTSTGSEREARNSRVEIRATDIIEALKKMEDLMLGEHDHFSILPPIGGQIVQVRKIEEETE